MTLSELKTIASIMNNDCPSGRVEVIHTTNGRYVEGKWQQDGTVPKGVSVTVMWHRVGHFSKVVGKFRTESSGRDVRLETIDGGIVDKYVRLVQLASN